jgi:hypothetical protein
MEKLKTKYKNLAHSRSENVLLSTPYLPYTNRCNALK